MALYRKKGSKILYCKFDFQGKEIRRSTGCTNKRDALTVQSKLRCELALGNWGILEEKRVEVTLEEFLKKHFITGEIKPKTREYYENGIEKLLDSDMAELPLNKITKQDAQRYVAKHVRPADEYKSEQRQEHLKNGKYSPSSVNCVLRTLRRALSVAYESGMLEKVPPIELAKNERRRDRVVSAGEQQRYLEKCVQPAKDVVVLMLDTGMRPEEIYLVRWESVEFAVTPCGNPLRLGTIHIAAGKTKHARRDLPLTMESYGMLKARFEAQGRPAEGWVFPAPTISGHIEESSIRKQHLKAIKDAELEHFELYCFRHTFLTILGSSGCDPYTLCRVAGHGDIQMGMRYCHPQREFIEMAFDRMVSFRQKGVTAGGYRQIVDSRSQSLALPATSSSHVS